MDEKTVRTLVAAGAVKQIHIIADGGLFPGPQQLENGEFGVGDFLGCACHGDL